MLKNTTKTLPEIIWHYCFLGICAMIFIFLIAPIIMIIPLSFNVEPYFTFTPKMLSFDPEGYSTRWYEAFFNSKEWMLAIKNSFIVGICSTLLASIVGTIAALGLSSKYMPYRTIIMSILISPMIVPLIITAASMFFFYSRLGISQSFLGVILSHTALGIPFVIITVTATLSGFDHSLSRAAHSLGASPSYTFFKIILPLVAPGVISGSLFAFITSFDEVVVVLFISGPEQLTIPIRMWAGIREEINPTILAVATLLVCISIVLLSSLEMLRRRNERMRGLTPG